MLTCKSAAKGMDYCRDRGVSGATLGKTLKRDTWGACMADCKKDAACKAWTYNPTTKVCSKKKRAEFVFQKGGLSGPVEGGTIPQPVNCGASSVAEYKYNCDTTIPSRHNIGDPVFKTTWEECRSACNGDVTCKAYTYGADGQCQKKKERDFQPLKGYVSGPRSGPWAADSFQIAGEDTPSSSSSAQETDAPVSTAPALTAAPTAVKWWEETSPLGVQWWVAIVVALVVLLLFGCCGVAMIAMM